MAPEQDFQQAFIEKLLAELRDYRRWENRLTESRDREIAELKRRIKELETRK